MDHLVGIKAALAAFLSALAAFLGWRGIMAAVWVVAMAMDYISGTAAACKSGQWSSQRAREGLWHKGGCILVVTVAAIADGILGMAMAEMALGFNWPGAILPLVLAWYIITELGSILENAVDMGASVPAWLIKLLKISLKAVDNSGNSVAGED